MGARANAADVLAQLRGQEAAAVLARLENYRGALRVWTCERSLRMPDVMTRQIMQAAGAGRLHVDDSGVSWLDGEGRAIAIEWPDPPAGE